MMGKVIKQRTFLYQRCYVAKGNTVLFTQGGGLLLIPLYI